MSIVMYPIIRQHADKSDICPSCGKRAKRHRSFYQTINPRNRRADGAVKSRDDIRAELRAMAQVWVNSPTYHARCEK